MEYTTVESLKDIFYYEGVTIPEEGICKISPSQISLFFENPVVWCKRNLLGLETENGMYTGDTGRILGTILHLIYECRIHNYKLSKSALEEALQLYIVDNSLEYTVDYDKIVQLYPIMSEVTINDYLNNVLSKQAKVHTETTLCTDLGDGIFLAGRNDLSYGTIASDYKNVSTKPSNTDTIPFNYKVQLLAYADMINQSRLYDEHISHIELSYTVRPTKTIGPRNFVVRERITDDDKTMFTNTIKLMKDSILHVINNPEDTYKIFKSMQFKEMYDEGKLIWKMK